MTVGMKPLTVAILFAALAFAAHATPALSQTAEDSDFVDPCQPTESTDDEQPTYDPHGPIPAGYVVEEQPRRWMSIAGGATLAATYGLSLLTAVFTRQNPDDYTFEAGWMVLPVVGPWIAAATAKNKCGYGGWGAERRYYCVHDDQRGFLLLLGGGQVVGVLLGASAYRFPSKRLVRGQSSVSDLSVSVSPLGQTGYGLSVAGRL